MESKFLNFVDLPNAKQKTKTFDVVAKSGNGLGVVKWFPRWRRYTFFPNDGTIFDAACLQSITAFIDGLMQARGVWRK